MRVQVERLDKSTHVFVSKTGQLDRKWTLSLPEEDGAFLSEETVNNTGLIELIPADFNHIR